MLCITPDAVAFTLTGRRANVKAHTIWALCLLFCFCINRQKVFATIFKDLCAKTGAIEFVLLSDNKRSDKNTSKQYRHNF